MVDDFSDMEAAGAVRRSRHSGGSIRLMRTTQVVAGARATVTVREQMGSLNWKLNVDWAAGHMRPLSLVVSQRDIHGSLALLSDDTKFEVVQKVIESLVVRGDGSLALRATRVPAEAVSPATAAHHSRHSGGCMRLIRRGKALGGARATVTIKEHLRVGDAL